MPPTDPAPPFVHEKALCESDTIGPGTNVWAFAHVMKGAVIGADCNIGGGCFIEAGAVIGNGVVIKNGVSVWNGVTIGDNAFIGPGAFFTNDKYPRSRHLPAAAGRYEDDATWLLETRIGEGASIGAGAVICPGLTVGAYASVAAGAVVTKDVAPNTLVAGNPAKPVGTVSEAGRPE